MSDQPNDAALLRAELIEARDAACVYHEAWSEAHEKLSKAESERDAALAKLSEMEKERDVAVAKLKEAQWIPCSERMPEPGQKVWVTCGDEVAMDSTFRSIVRNGVRLGLLPSDDQPCEILFDKFRNVTHWQPIIPPTPPFDRGAEVKP